MPAGTISTIRPKDTRDLLTLTSEDRIAVDHPTLGVGTIRYADLQAQLEGVFLPAVNAAAASAATSAATATTQAGIATAQAGSATTSAATATTQAGVATAKSAEASASASAAAASAATATTQAGIATAQASEASASAAAALVSESAASTSAATSTTQAGIAAAQATIATTKAAEASASAGAAASGASAATTQAGVATTKAGEAAASAAAALASENSAAASAATATTQAGIATAQAGVATTKASEASASAAAALNAQATEYLGAVAGTAVPSTAPLKGQYYIITAAGTSQGVTWALGDKAIYNGPSGSWSRVTGFLAASNSYAESLAATREASGYLQSDGVTSSRAQIQTPGPRGNLAGAPLASWVGWVEVPTSNPAPTCYIASQQNTAQADGNNGTGLNISIDSGGVLFVIETSGGFSNRRAFYISGFRATYSGRRIWLEVRVTGGSATAPVIRVDGVQLGGLTASNAGTPPDWLNPATSYGFHYTAALWPAGVAPLGCWLNAHLTDAESEAWRTTGRPPAWVAAGGSALVLNTSAFASANSFPTPTVATATRVAGTDSSGAGWLSLVPAGITVQARQIIELRGNVAVYTNPINSSIIAGGIEIYSTEGAITAAGAFRRTFLTRGAGVVDLRIIRFISGGGAYDIDSIAYRCIGALSLPVVQPLLVVDDATMLGGNSARLVGMVPVTDRKDWRIVTSTGTSGNQQLLGGSLYAEPQRNRISSWVVNNIGSNTRTVSLGQSSGATTYVSGASCPVGRSEITLATRFPASGQPNLWVNSNGADTLVHTITGHRVGA